MFRRTVFIITAVCLMALISMYGYWLLQSAAAYSLVALIMSALACFLFGIVGARCVKMVFVFFDGRAEIDVAGNLGKRSLRPGNRHPAFFILFAVLAFRLLIYIAAYALLVIQKGYQGALLDTLSIWLKGDAPHYLGIAENYYVTAGDPRFHIVFFPFYPLLVRACNALIHNVYVSGFFVTIACTALSGVLLYELALLDMDRSAAKRAVIFQMLLPAACLLNAPMSDSLFLALTLLCMLLLRKKHYVAAAIVGALASYTRVLGIIVLVPYCIEMLADFMRAKKKHTPHGLVFATRLLGLFVIPLGLLTYLVINKNVTGDAFTFLTYQREHWYQQMGFFFNTAAYQSDRLLSTWTLDTQAAYGLWLPNLVFLFGAPLLIYAAIKTPSKRALEEKLASAGHALREEAGISLFEERPAQAILEGLSHQPYALRPSYVAYFLAYYACSMGATWLLSAPRYLTCCFPLAIAAASLIKRRGSLMLAYVLLALMQIAYLYMYVGGYPIY